MRHELFYSFLCTFFISNSIAETSKESQQERTFTVDYEASTFRKDGEKFRYVSGSIHYFRSPADKWDSLLRKMRLGGLNAITTYTAWNMHQPTPELKYNFEGDLNLFNFLKLAHKNDLLVILRPGPFIDAERDMGGFPAWLLWVKQGIKLRTSDLDYNYFVSRWFDELLPRLKPFLYSNGGPIIMMQVENEYGSFGCDKNYTSFIRDQIRYHLGNDLVLFTNDGAGDRNLQCGSVPGVLPTLDFGPDSLAGIKQAFDLERKYSPHGPLVNSEFYPGWLDHWQKPHNKQTVKTVADSVNNILSLGANINIYMYHGGTSFGYGSGANLDGDMYDPCPTSYDYDAPLTEAGDPTAKYFALKKVISQYINVSSEDPVSAPKASYGNVPLKKFSHVLDSKFLTIFGGSAIKGRNPPSFEELKISNGFVLYQKQINFLASNPVELKAPQLKDRAFIYVDREFVGILSRTEHIYSIPLEIRTGQTISILVENQGRMCFGSQIGESKGIGQNVTLGSSQILDWTVFPLGEIIGNKLLKYSKSIQHGSLDSNSRNVIREVRNQGSGSFYAGNFTIKKNKLLDTYVRLDGFSKGLVWVNGINLGRYWPIVGPQETLYLPSSFLKTEPDTNTIIIFELQRSPAACVLEQIHPYNETSSCFITLTDTHVIDGPTPYSGETVANSLKRKFTLVA